MPDKNEIRNINKKIRSSMTEKEVRTKSSMAAEIFLNSDIYKKSKILMLYMPLGNETDTTQIAARAFSDGKKVVFPVTDMINDDIIPYYADEKTEFENGAYSISEPRNAKKALISEIDVVVVPGIAFSKSGDRIGFGKGYYDKFLKNTSAVKIGFCYEFQVCNEITADAHDISMDLIITEKRVYVC